MFLRSLVHSWNLSQKFYVEVPKWVYLSNHYSESINIWAMGIMAGLLPIHTFWPQGSCPGVGLEVKKNYDTLKSVILLFLSLLTHSKDISHPYDMSFCVLR